MHPPHRSYIIWMTPRTGSTLLSELLAQSQQLGHPHELFTLEPHSSLAEHYQVDSWERLRDELWSRSALDTGCMALKYGIYRSRHEPIVQELRQLQGLAEVDLWNWAPFEELFPRCQHLFLTRRNKLRQVISWWKAIQDQQWHLRPGQSREQTNHFYEDKYDFAALQHLLKEVQLREAATQQFFSDNNLTPLTVVYEDLIQDVVHQLGRILAFLGLEPQLAAQSKPSFLPTRSEINDQWEARLREDLQTGWNHRAW
ncbi:MAG: Stf0 family sulfotransferase [Bacteroidota bacterium]